MIKITVGSCWLRKDIKDDIYLYVVTHVLRENVVYEMVDRDLKLKIFNEMVEKKTEFTNNKFSILEKVQQMTETDDFQEVALND